MPKRRLPVLQSQGDSEEPPRAPWQWVGFGAAAIFGTWLPLSVVFGAVAARFLAHASDEAAQRRAAFFASAGYALELGVGALAGGYLLGKWGPAKVGVREAAIAGLVAAAVLAAVEWVSVGPSIGLVLLALIAPVAAAWGGRLGLRNRPGRA